MPKQYRSSLKTSDFITANIALQLGKWVEIGARKVEAGIYLGLGFGFSNSQSDADGRIYAVLKDTAAVEVIGEIRLAPYTPDEMPFGPVVAEIPTNKLNSSATDMTKQLPFPAQGGPIMLGQDYQWKMFFRPSSIGNGTLGFANCVINMDATKASKAG